MTRGSQDFSTLPRSREEARARGFDRFYTGVRCKHGHLAARYVSTTNCAACQVEHARKNGGWGARPSREQFFAQARELIEARGGALISTTYVSAKSKLHVRCDRGHEFETNFDRLKQGKWCPTCKSENHAQRMTADLRPVEELREFARRQHGGDCLAVAPSPMLLKVRWKCANEAHPPFEATIAKVLHSDQWCPACWQERRQPPNPQVELETVAALVRERGGEILKVGKNGVWAGSKTRLALRCANGHEWPTDASNVLYAGSWCPDCLNKGERIVRAIFEATYGQPFPKSKPDWLVSGKGRKLELDGYSASLAMAFEYQGPHHFSVDHVMAHDELKRQACAKNGVRLIEVRAAKRPFPPENVLAEVAVAFRTLGIDRQPVMPVGELFPDELRQLQELARKRDGTVVSNRYLGSDEVEWHCGNPEHPPWKADVWRVVKRGAWCPSCAGNRRLSLEDLRTWGASIGLVLLDTERGGTQARYRWRCGKDHVIERTRGNILASMSNGLDPCTECAGTSRRAPNSKQ